VHQFVSSEEFAHFRDDIKEMRRALEKQIEVGFGGINARLDSLNGRTRSAEQTIAVVERRLQAIESDDRSIEAVVTDIKTHGCAQLETHETVLRELGWSPRRKAVVAGGLMGAGAMFWPAIQKIAEAVHAFVERMPR
jgi:hypothetical protein